LFGHFSLHNSVLSFKLTFLEFLRDKQMIKAVGYGNTAKGTVATEAINNYARQLTAKYLLTPTTITTKEDGEDKQVDVPNLYLMKGRAALLELSQWNSQGNFDRVSALGMLMLLREDRMILMGGKKGQAERDTKNEIAFDNYFERNYHKSRWWNNVDEKPKD